MMSRKHCSICGEGQLSHVGDRNTVTYGEVQTAIPMVYSVCDVCGSEQTSSAQLRTNKQAMIAFQKQVDGLLSGEQLSELLRHLGLTQSAAARVFGGGAVAFSKYRNDDVKQSAAMDRLLRVAAAVPQAFEWLLLYSDEQSVVTGPETHHNVNFARTERSFLHHHQEWTSTRHTAQLAEKRYEFEISYQAKSANVGDYGTAALESVG